MLTVSVCSGGSHDGDNSGFYIGMVLQVWNLCKLPLSGATCQCRQKSAPSANVHKPNFSPMHRAMIPGYNLIERARGAGG
jgi:hypothetical protein